MKYCQGRIPRIKEYAKDNGIDLTIENMVDVMDEWLIDLWNKQVGKDDNVYILGDFSFHPAEYNKKLLGKLNGKKFLILGNHDGNSDSLTGYFEQITQIKEYKYRDESGETFCFEMCHYPMLSWNRKEHGTIQLAGHSHGNIDQFNAESTDLRVDVGIDGSLADYKFLTPDDILLHFYKKTCTKDFVKYQKEILQSGKRIALINWLKSFMIRFR